MFKPLSDNYEKKVKCMCGLSNIPSENEIKQCTTCNYSQHLKCLKEAANINRFYECPLCQFKNLDPNIEVLDNLVESFYLPFDDLINGSYKKSLKFFYKKEQSKKYREMIDQGKSIFLAIRCLRLDSIGYEHHWPLNCKMSLNRRTILDLKLAKYPPMSKPREDWPIIFNYENNKFHEKCKHISINNLLEENYLEFENNYKENDNDVYSYVISINVIKTLARSSIITRTENLKDRSILMRLLIDSNNLNKNNIISHEKVQLIDVYKNSTRINQPARGLSCEHASVFDLESFLSMNEKSRKWNCPRCNKKATRFYIDNFLLDFLEKNKDIKEINFNHENCSYSLIDEKMERLNKFTNSEKQAKEKRFIEIIDLELDPVEPSINSVRNIEPNVPDRNLNLKVERGSYNTFSVEKKKDNIYTSIPNFNLEIPILNKSSNQVFDLNSNEGRSSNIVNEKSKKLVEESQLNTNPLIDIILRPLESSNKESNILNNQIGVNSNPEIIKNNENKISSNSNMSISIIQNKMKINNSIANISRFSINKIERKLNTIHQVIEYNLIASKDRKIEEENIVKNYSIFYDTLVEKDEDLKKMRDFLCKKRNLNINN